MAVEGLLSVDYVAVAVGVAVLGDAGAALASWSAQEGHHELPVDDVTF